MNQGDKVRVKQGVMSETFESGEYGSPVYKPDATIDMSGYTGKVAFVYDPKESLVYDGNGEIPTTVEVDFDDETIGKIPQEYINDSIKNNVAYSAYVFLAEELEVVE